MRLVVALAFLPVGCAHDGAKQVQKDAKELSQAAGAGNEAAVRARAVPAARARVDTAEVIKGGRKGPWAKALAKPELVEQRAVVLLGAQDPVPAIRTDAGWRFAADPTDVYAQSTPRQALRALVRASRAGRWDVLVRLAPRRYRIGLSREDLEKAWTEGEHAKALVEARDQLAEHLADPIVGDAHEAVLRIDDAHNVRLEREGDNWVVVDF